MPSTSGAVTSDSNIPCYTSDEDNDEANLHLAIANRLHKTNSPNGVGDITLANIIRHILRSQNISGDIVMYITRSEPFSPALTSMRRPSFNPCRKVFIKVTDEEGIDNGVLTRDFFRLALLELKDMSRLLEVTCYSTSYLLFLLEKESLLIASTVILTV